MVALGFKIGARDPDGLMVRAATFGELFGQRRFVGFLSPCIPRNLRVTVRRFPPCSAASAAIVVESRPGREENADGDVGHEVVADGLLQSGAQKIGVGRLEDRLSRRLPISDLRTANFQILRFREEST